MGTKDRRPRIIRQQVWRKRFIRQQVGRKRQHGQLIGWRMAPQIMGFIRKQRINTISIHSRLGVVRSVWEQ